MAIGESPGWAPCQVTATTAALVATRVSERLPDQWSNRTQVNATAAAAAPTSKVRVNRP